MESLYSTLKLEPVNLRCYTCRPQKTFSHLCFEPAEIHPVTADAWLDERLAGLTNLEVFHRHAISNEERYEPLISQA